MSEKELDKLSDEDLEGVAGGEGDVDVSEMKNPAIMNCPYCTVKIIFDYKRVYTCPSCNKDIAVWQLEGRVKPYTG